MELPFGPSDVLCDRFEILERLGAPGETAYAVKARDLLTKEVVVLKIPLRGGARDLLLSQYQKLQAADSRHLARALAYYEHRDGQVAEPFLVLELIDGLPLSEWVVDKRIRARMEVLARVALALAELHEQGLEHGDVHSENIIMTNTGRVVLIDPQAATMGSTRPSRKTPVHVSDRAAFADLAAELAPAPSNAVAAIMPLLSDSPAPTPFRTVATQLQGLLSLEYLPGELTGSLADLAAWSANDVDTRRKMYRDALNSREAAFQSLLALVQPIANALALTGSHSDWLQARQHELRTVDAERGSLQNRTVCFKTEDADALWITLDGSSDFRKPFLDADRPSLLGKGTISVVRAEGAALASEAFEVVYLDDLLQIFLVQLDRRLRMDATVLERFFRILRGSVYSLIERPQDLQPPTPTTSTFGRPAESPRTEDKIRHSIEVFLRHRDGDRGVDLLTFRDKPAASRLNLLESLRKRLVSGIGSVFQRLYRFDVSLGARNQHVLSIDIEGHLRALGPVSWHFELDTRPPKPGAEPARS